MQSALLVRALLAGLTISLSLPTTGQVPDAGPCSPGLSDHRRVSAVPGQVPDARVSKPRSLLRSLLCCLGRRRGSRSPSPSPAPEENGHLSASAGGPARPAVLLPPVTHHDMGRVCLVVDLDETLVHSSFKVGIGLRRWMAQGGS